MTLIASPLTVSSLVIAIDLLCLVCVFDEHRAESGAAPILVIAGLFATLIGAAELAGARQ